MSIKFDIQNITDILPQIDNDVLLNPSVCHWKHNLFICTYRVFTRNNSSPYTSIYNNPNHPWLGGEGSHSYWNSEGGYDHTRICLLEITDDSVSFVKYYGYIQGQDIRVYKVDDNRFAITGNTVINNDSNVNLSSTNCEKGCYLIFVRILTMLSKKKINISQGIILCPEVSNKIEKNWSIWKNPQGQFLVSYGVSPSHEVFTLQLQNNLLQCTAISKIHGNNRFFEKLIKFYNNIIFISLSTPALRRKNGNYIAFGHVKYKYKNIDKINPSTNLFKFNKKIKNKNLHPTFVYLMFLYEFSSQYPYSITRISNMFIPESEFSLVFATNLTRNTKGTYILSYGEHDSECWLLYMTEKEVEDALITITDPQDLQFLLI